MNMSSLFSSLLDREVAISRRVLQSVPEGRPDWKPHQKSMPLGYLATLVATMPGWVAMAINQDELDLNPPGGSPHKPPEWGTAEDLGRLLEASAAQARDALAATSEDHLHTPWRLLVGGNVVLEQPRHVIVADTFTHMAHHRGQLTVYMRLNGAPVPSVYGPSADDRSY